MSVMAHAGPPPLPPAAPPVGTAGHTTDHATIAALLAWLESAVTALQGAPGSFALNGGNVATMPGTSVSWAQVNVQPGQTVDVLDFYSGQQKIFSLNSYGEPRITAAALTHVAEIIYALAGQTADVWQIQSAALAVLARVGPAGDASFAGPVSRWVSGAPAAWVHPALQSGWQAYSSRTLAVKLTNDNMVQISGQLVPGQTSDGTPVAALPAGFAPQYRPEAIPLGQSNLITAANYRGPYLEAETSGNLNVYSLGTISNSGGGHLVVSGRYPLDAR